MSQNQPVFKAANFVPLLLAIGVSLGVWMIPKPEGIEPRAWQLLAIFVGFIIALIGKALSMGALSFLTLTTLVLTHTLSLKEAFSGFSHPIVWLVVAAFLISRSIIKTGLGMRLAYQFVGLFGKKTLGLGYAVCATELLLAPAMPSSTARGGGIIFPLVRALAETFNSSPERHSQRQIGSFLIMVGYYSNVISSAMFLTAIASNPIIISILQGYGIQISWGQWALAASLPGLACFLLMPLMVYKLYPPEIKETPQAKEIAQRHLNEMKKMTQYEWLTLFIFSGLVILWILGEPYLGIDSTTVAFLGISCFVLSGVLTWEDIKKEHEAWDTLIWFSTLVMMATFMNSLGLVDWISHHIHYLMSDLNWWQAWPSLVAIYFYSHYFFAGNTSHVSSMFAVFFGVGIALGTPTFLMAFSLIGASSFFAVLTHYGTGCAPIFFGSEYVSFKQWWRLGAIVGTCLLLLWIVLGAFWWKFLGLW